MSKRLLLFCLISPHLCLQTSAEDRQAAATHAVATKRTEPTAAPPPKIADELLRLHNTARAAHDKPPLAISGKLNCAAQKFAEFMARTRRYDHTADGRSTAERIEAEGYSWAAWAENIGWGTSSPVEAFDGWMNSEAHRANVLSDLREVGFGFAEGVWVVVYGTQLQPPTEK